MPAVLIVDTYPPRNRLFTKDPGMSITGTFRSLARLFEYWETRGWRVARVEGDEGALISTGETALTVELRTPASTIVGDESGTVIDLGSAGIEDGRVTFDLTGSLSLVPPDSQSDDLVIDDIGDCDVEDGELSFVVSVVVTSGDPAAVESETSDAQTDAEETGQVDDGEAGDAVAGDADADDRAAPPRIERRRPDVPPFADEEYLQAVYDAYDTFAEMADELDMDVTTETVRRYMIDAGVHRPTRYNVGSREAETDSDEPDGTGGPDTSTEGDRSHDQAETSGAHTATATPADEDATDSPTDGAEEAGPQPDSPGDDDAGPIMIADGIGLPEDLSVDEFIEIVRSSRTVYEVKRQMHVDWEAARDILAEYNLLDLVMGQLAMESDLYVSRDEVVQRIRESAATT